MGYVSGDAYFYISNSLGGVKIPSNVYVDNIYINGQSITDLFVSKTSYDGTIGGLATSNTVYSKLEVDNKFLTKAGGLSDLVKLHADSGDGKAYLRKEIDALGTKDMEDAACIKSNSFADIASYGLSKDSSNYMSDLAVRKQKLCDNIGAAYSPDTQKKLKDSGWVNVLGGIYARQIGNIVCVQGTATLSSDPGDKAIIFTIPNSIDAPTKDCYMEYSRYEYLDKVRGMKMMIDGGSRSCYVIENSLDGRKISINLTYMV